MLPEPAAVTEKPGRRPGIPAWYITAAVAHGADKAGDFANRNKWALSCACEVSCEVSCEIGCEVVAKEVSGNLPL
jgi:hypothetical protein